MLILVSKIDIGAIQVLRNADGDGGVNFSGEKRYEGVSATLLTL